MSVNTYLVDLASSLVLNGDEKSKIDTSIETLQNRIIYHFTTNVIEHYKFGSSTRSTILPRKADEQSDIDYMVVFNVSDGTYKPQTYLDKLKTFVVKYYSSSEIKQSHPTIVLELQHIKFDIVPAIKDVTGYKIPSPSSDWNDWMNTNPNLFNQTLTTANTNNKSLIKPLVRLMKYWNAENGHSFNSFSLETHIVGRYYFSCNSLKDYFFDYWFGFNCEINAPQYIKDKVQHAKDTVTMIQNLEREGKTVEAENELAKFLPKI